MPRTRYKVERRLSTWNTFKADEYWSLGSESVGDYTLRCSYLPTSKWGFLGSNQAWLLKLELTFPDCQLDHAMIELKFSAMPEGTDPPPSRHSRPTVTQHFAPRDFNGDIVARVITKKSEVKTSLNFNILDSGGIFAGVGRQEQEIYSQINQTYYLKGYPVGEIDGSMTGVKWTMQDSKSTLRQQTTPRRSQMFAAAIIAHHLKPFLIEINVKLGKKPGHDFSWFRAKSRQCRPVKVVPVKMYVSLDESAANLEAEIARQNVKPVAEALASKGVLEAQQYLKDLASPVQAPDAQDDEPADEAADELAGEGTHAA